MKRLIALTAVAAGTRLAAQTPQPIDVRHWQNTAQFSFLRPILDSVDVVSLGESLHLTSEFPLVRIGMIRYLNENLGFDVAALEGSPEDVWVAQDKLLASARYDSDITAALSGLFPIWNTRDVRELIAGEVDSWKTAHPFYVTAYDVQPGTGQRPRGAAVFDALAERLTRYVPPPPGVSARTLTASLAPLTNACAKYSKGDSAGVEEAISKLQSWTAAAAPVVDVPFAESGVVPLIYSDVNDDIAFGPVRVGDSPAARRLARSTSDVFVNLRAANDSAFTASQRMMVEGQPWPVTPAHDFDGMIWVKRAHSPRFITAGFPLMLVGLSTEHYWRPITIALVMLVAFLVWNQVRRRFA